jgi:hypothetical protein
MGWHLVSYCFRISIAWVGCDADSEVSAEFGLMFEAGQRAAFVHLGALSYGYSQRARHRYVDVK